MKVLLACEFSGIVREAFAELGHESISCDLLPTELPCSNYSGHYQGDVCDLLSDCWDLMIAFPPCTHLCASGARWWPDKKELQKDALDFVLTLMNTDIPSVALENPIGIISSAIRKPDQIIQPWQFGDGYVKTTCLWLKGLPLLTPTNVVSGREQKCWKMPPSPTRAQDRARTYPGIAKAMASQWGGI